MSNEAERESAPAGYVVVPVEPSEKMLDILYHNGPGLDDHLLVAIWAELLAAAPRADVPKCESPSCGCADAYCKAWDEEQPQAAPQPSDDVAKGLVEALELSANRLDRLRLEVNPLNLANEVADWTDEAREALATYRKAQGAKHG